VPLFAQWTVFENIKEHIVAKRAGKPLATHESLLLGGLAGSAAALFTCPVDGETPLLDILAEFLS
jgi:hypothetical protein